MRASVYVRSFRVFFASYAGECHVTGRSVDPKQWMGKHVTRNGVDPVLTSYAGECHVTIMRPDERNHVTGRCADLV